MTPEELHVFYLAFKLKDFYKTGIFHAVNQYTLSLPNTLFILTTSIQDDLVWMDFESWNSRTTEEVLNAVPEELQIELLFHLDLLQRIRS